MANTDEHSGKGDTHESDLEIAPIDLSGRSAPEPDIIRWVARNIDNPDVDANDCPDPFAWTMLRQCKDRGKSGEAFRAFFIEKLWAKLIPSRSQQSDDKDNGDYDGSPTVELIERIQAMSDEAKHSGVEQLAARQPHSLEVAGSSPASAIEEEPRDYFHDDTPGEG